MNLRGLIHRRRVSMAAIVASLAWACSPSMEPGTRCTVAPASSNVLPSAAASKPAPTRPKHGSPTHRDAVLLHQVDTMLKVVSRIRQLPVAGAVRGQVIGRPEMLRRLRTMIHEELPADQIRGEQQMLIALGLMPVGYDYEAGVMRLLESQLAGYYDPKEDTMFLMADLGAKSADVTLAHELVHALQDQHYDLAQLTKYRPGHGDEIAAIHCLAEGDATSAMIDYALQGTGRSSLNMSARRLRLTLEAGTLTSPELAREPHILLSSLMASYTDGFALVTELRAKGGWAAVDEVWRHPPETTEQVLHVKKLLVREPALALPAVPGPQGRAGLVALERDRMGEQGFRLVLQEWLPRTLAVKAAAGWGGDQAVVFEDRDRAPWLAWRIQFDKGGMGQAANAQAREAWTSFRKARVGTLVTARLGNRAKCWKVNQGRGVVVVRWQNRDIVITAVPIGDGNKAGITACRTASQWSADAIK